jgi:RND family efflux transporter MFP subunit
MSELVKKIIKVLIVVVILAGIILFAYGQKKEQPYQEGVVTRGDVYKTINVDATINPDVYANISSELPTRIKKVYVEENSKISKGDKLFELDKKSISAQISNARLAVERAELAEKKARRKWDTLKPEERESIKKETEQSRQTLYELYAQAEKTTVTSPIDGVIIEQNAREGEVAQGTIVRIIDQDSLRVEALIPEVDIAKVQKGDKAVVIFDAYPDKTIQGELKSMDITKTIKENNTYYKANVDIKEQGKLVILDGMNAEVDIQIDGRESVLIVSRKFTKKDEMGYFVYVLSGKKRNKEQFSKKYFQAGIIGDNFIEIISGLENEEKIVLPENLN